MSAILIAVGIDATAPTRLPRLFAQAGCSVSVYCPPHRAVISSRFVKKWIRASPDPVIFDRELQDVVTRKAYDWVILASEPLLLRLSARIAEPWVRAIFPSTDPDHASGFFLRKLDLIESIQDKVEVPRFKRVGSIEELKETIKTFSYPYIVRSQVSMTGSGIAKIDEPEDFDREWPRLNAFPVLVQEFVEGRLGATDVLFNRGEPVCWSTTYKTDCWPTPLSASCARSFTDHPDAERMLREIGKATGFHGLAGVDWIHNETTGRLVFLELNPRPTPVYHLGPGAGVDFSLAIRQVLEGRPQLQRPHAITQGPSTYLFPEGIYRAIQAKSLPIFLKSCSGAPWADPGLLAALSRRIMTHYLPKNLRSMMRRGMTRK